MTVHLPSPTKNNNNNNNNPAAQLNIFKLPFIYLFIYFLSESTELNWPARPPGGVLASIHFGWFSFGGGGGSKISHAQPH